MSNTVTRQKALFLDRDGVINKDLGYVYKIEDFYPVDGIYNLCKKFQNEGYKIIVVTNQSGIAREYYSQKDFEILSNWMLESFLEKGIKINGVYFCPHHPDINGDCDCRKPKPGMFIRAMEEHNVDLSKSVMYGDKKTDIEAAENAGLKKAFLVDSTSGSLVIKKEYNFNLC